MGVGKSNVAATWRYRWIQWLFIGVIAIIVGIWGVTKPLYCWDIAGYVGAAYKADGLSREEVFRRSWQDMRESLTSGYYTYMTSGKHALASESEIAYDQLICFYDHRVALVSAARIVGRCGWSYSRSILLVCSLSAALLVVMVGLFCIQLDIPVWVLPVIASLSGITELATSSTPDAMASLAAVSLVYMYIRGIRYWMILVMLLPLIRTDHIVWAALFSAYAFVQGHRRSALLASGVAVLVYLINTKLHPGYSWATLFEHTVCGPFMFPGDIKASFDFRLYISRMWTSLGDALNNIQVAVIFLGGIAWMMNREKGKALEAWLLFVCPFVFMVMHQLLFPVYLPRFYVFPTVLVMLFLLKNLSMLRERHGAI